MRSTRAAAWRRRSILALVAALLLMAGLTSSLAVRQRRVYVRVRGASGGSHVSIGALGLTRLGPPEGEIETLAQALGRPPPGNSGSPGSPGSAAPTHTDRSSTHA